MKTFKTYHYNSLYEFMDKAEKTPINKRHSSIRIGPSIKIFSQSANLNEAIQISRNGKDLALIDSKLNEIKTAEKTEIEISHSVCGMVPDVPEFLTGAPECMINYEQMPKEVNCIHLVLQIDEAGKRKPKQFLNRSIAIASIINDLEVNGYRVKLSLANLCRFNVGLIGVITDLKNYDESLGLSEIAGVLHPSFLRRIDFLWTEGRSWFTNKGKYDEYYGHVQHIEVMKAFLDQELGNEKHLLIPSVSSIKKSDDMLYTKCHYFETTEGAKVYANHITDQIRGL